MEELPNVRNRAYMRRIRLTSFRPFDCIEFKPGKNLNLLLSPNGCGKSSLISGIMLGLCGRPSEIGRGSQLGSFVKSGYESAKIEIELHNKDNNKEPFIITRTITKDNKSQWSLNGNRATQKQVEELVAKLNIQVDNLCQVLPQDRVYEFARLNPQALLESTERTVGQSKMYYYHNILKDLSKKLKGMETKREELTKRLDDLSEQNKRLEVDLESMRKRQAFLDQLKKIKEDHAWICYQDQFTSVQNLRNDNKALEKLLINLRAERDKVKENLKQMKDAVGKKDLCLRKKTEELERLQRQLRGLMDQCEHQENAIVDAQNDIEQGRLYEQRRLLHLEQNMQHLRKLENDLANTKVPSEEEMVKINKEISKKMDTMKEENRQIKQEEVTVRTKLDNIDHEIKEKEATKKKCEGESAQRIDKLKKNFPDTYNALLWLRQHKHEFVGKICEPMMLELELKDPSYAPFLEATISRRDIVAFTCENVSDMNKFLDIMRRKLKLNVNALHSGSNYKPSYSYKSPYSLDELSVFGFKLFVMDMFTAPEPIMRYLCRTYGVYRVPVGGDLVDTDFVKVPLQVFFSDKCKYISRISQYTGEKISSITKVQEANLLAKSKTQEFQLAELRLKELYVKREGHQKTLLEIKERISSIDCEIDKLREETNKLSSAAVNHQNLIQRIKKRKAEIADVESKKLDEEAEEKKSKEKIMKAVKTRVKLQKELSEKMKLYCDVVREDFGLKFQLQDSAELCKQAEDRCNDLLKRYSEQEVIQHHLKRRIPEETAKAKKLHADALALSDGKMPPKKFFDEAASKPGAAEALASEIQDMQAQADFYGGDNEAALIEFQMRKRKILEVTQEMEELEKRMEGTKASVITNRDQWLPLLEDLISKINQKFSSYFRMMGCSGEVHLTKQNPDAYDQYGLVLKVKFRDSDNLQDLNSSTQSGGERSVTTALYMIALQELTFVPFRIVDEVNQGMDPINERRVYEVLIKATQNQETAQYFLLTPKLLPNLEYPSNVTIMVIVAGCLDDTTTHIHTHHLAKEIKRNEKKKEKGRK